MHYHVSNSLKDLAKVYSAQEKYEQAEVLLLRSLAIRENAYEPNHPRIATNLYLLARVYDDQGAFEQAISYYQRALAIQQQALGEEHPETRATLEHFAELQRKVQGGGKEERGKWNIIPN
jgi:tetratricopeptide (TPR) repeat protein